MRKNMYKLAISLFLLCSLVQSSLGQAPVDTIAKWKEKLSNSKSDSSLLAYNYFLARDYRFSNTDSSFYYTDAALAIARKMGMKTAEALCLSLKGATLLETGNLPESMKYQFEAQEISTEIKDTGNLASTLNRIGNIYMELADYKNANDYYFKSLALFKQLRDTSMYFNEISNIGNVYALDKKTDSALYYQTLVYDSYVESKGAIGFVVPEMMFRMGNAYELKGEVQKALNFYKTGVLEAGNENDVRNLTMNNLQLARLYFEKTALIDSARHFAYAAYQSGTKVVFRKGILEACLLLAKIYQHKPDSAVKYLSLANTERDLLFGASRFQDIQRMVLEQQQQQQEIQKERERIAVRNRTLLLLAVLLLMVVLAIYFFNNNRKQKRVNATLHEQRLKISSQNDALTSTLLNLKSTQTQLIQAEKMASLGELTAGIAHEIQNPLNFVNNFSEVSNELVDEMQEELEKGDLEEAKFIAADIKSNLEKINHHGKRAQSIVTGMLQHSRSGKGEKQLTDINKLADEYLRLAYHGLRSKDKNFNCDIETSFDDSIGQLNIIPQEIGRVILNLVNNAFYAVNEKVKSGQAEPVEAPYKAKLSVSTKIDGNRVLITVADNGNGIPDKITDKIFNPFFTTKPTGQGTGLGLSLSYDIVKAHGGEIRVVSEDGQGTKFTITIPA